MQPDPATLAGPDHRAGRGAWLTRAAFVLALALVLARATMLEMLREPFAATVGQAALPRAPMAGAGILLDLLCWVPAMLVLARAAMDRTFRLRCGWTEGLFVALGLLAVASTAWSADRYAALLLGFHLLSAAILFFAVGQVVRTWGRLRAVGAVCFGLLLTYIAQGLYYQYVELPDLQRVWQIQRGEVLRQRGWEEGSFAARQFEGKILRGEMMGFSASPNTYAASLVLLGVVTLGLLLQRLKDRDGAAWAAVYGLALAGAAWVGSFTQSRAAMVSPLLAAGCLAVLWVARDRLARHHRFAFAAGAAAVLLGIAAVAGHGWYHGTLPSDSLEFRWRYWVGAAGVFGDHPWLGTGWGNFGAHYLAHRVAAAAEEIRDPHNFLVRFFVELGLLGGALAVGWLATLWWRMTRPLASEATDPADPGPVTQAGVLPYAGTSASAAAYAAADASPSRPIARYAWIAGLAMLINTIASVDFGQNEAYAVVELFERFVYAALLVLGGAVAGLVSLEKAVPDHRPGPWVVYGLTVGAGVFLLHNLVDVSMFEVGATFLLSLVAGAVVGVRSADLPGRPGPRLAGALLGVTALAWLGVAVLVAVPVVRAELMSEAGNQAVGRGELQAAADHYAAAHAVLPWDAENAFRAARALAFARAPADEVRAWVDRAIAGNPVQVEYYLFRTGVELSRPAPDPTRVRADFDRAVALNPNEVRVRLDYGDALTRLGYADAARVQYRAALHYNDLLDPTEPERLTDREVAEVRSKIGG